MSLDKWPEYMVMPSAEDFVQQQWETKCGTRGCAYGWVCTAFGVSEITSGGPTRLGEGALAPTGSPAGAFAESLALHLGADIDDYRGSVEWQGPSGALSDVFEQLPPSDFGERVEKAWREAARDHGYTVNAGRFR